MSVELFEFHLVVFLSERYTVFLAIDQIKPELWNGVVVSIKTCRVHFEELLK
jgi:hypothetical protein